VNSAGSECKHSKRSDMCAVYLGWSKCFGFRVSGFNCCVNVGVALTGNCVTDVPARYEVVKRLGEGSFGYVVAAKVCRMCVCVSTLHEVAQTAACISSNT
jgi:hypothetical protein